MDARIKSGHDDRICIDNWARPIILAKQIASESFEISSAPTEGAGNAGRLARPQPCVQMKKARKQVTASFAGTSRHSPRGWF
jgi:hypothetical protein